MPRAAAAPRHQPLRAPAAHGAGLLASRDVPVRDGSRRGERTTPDRAPCLLASPPAERYDHEVVATGGRGTLLAYRSDVWHRGTNFTDPAGQRIILVAGFRPAAAEWFSYDALGRHGDRRDFADFVAGKSPDELALVGIPRPGHPYWTAATLDVMATKYPGLDLSPWRQPHADPYVYALRVRRIQIYMTEELDDRLELEAATHGTSKAALIRDAVAERYGAERAIDPIDALVGSMDGEPVDDIDGVIYA